MIPAAVILARKYVAAYMHIYADHWLQENVRDLIEFADIFHERRAITAYLKLTCITPETKMRLIQKSLATYQLDGLLAPLIDLLLQHKRLEILSEVLHALSVLLQEWHNVAEVTLRTAAPISSQSAALLINALEQKIHKNVYARDVVDQRLIAGVRFEGRNFLWERSIRQQLRHIAIVS